MRRNIIIGLVCVAIVAVLGAVYWLRPPSMMSFSRPEMFVIEWVEGGGMIPEGSYAMITEGESYREYKEYPAGVRTVERVDFTVSAEEMDDLYAMLRREGFDTIRTVEEEYYDGDNAMVRITAPSEASHEVYEMVVHDWDAARYQRVYEAIAVFLNERAL
jgi:hypothetical protein